MLIFKRIATIVLGGSIVLVTVGLVVIEIVERIKRKKKDPWYKDFLD